MDLKLKIGQKLSQSQSLVMTQRLQQALRLLQMPTLEFEQVLRQELENNPLLEEYEPEEDEEAEEDSRTEEDLEFDEFLKDGFQNSTSNNEPDDDYYERPTVAIQTGQQQLAEQLAMVIDDKLDKQIGEYLIGSLGDDGLLTCPLSEVAAYYEVDEERVEKVLMLLQSFDPPGIGARDLQECLLLQLKAKKMEDSLEAEIIRNHFESLKLRKFAVIAKAMKMKPIEIQELAASIGELDPKPGMSSSAGSAEYITPDLRVEKIDDEYVVSLIDSSVPRLRVSKIYDGVQKGSGGYDHNDVKFIDEKRDYAEWIVRTIEQRRRTMIKVMETIVEKQFSFFEQGPLGLNPLTLQQVADVIEMHESTVSRVTKDKYVETHRGVLPLKFFFAAGLDTVDGGNVSNKAVRIMIEQIVAGEDSAKPLSDKKIADLLSEKGTVIARRTVAKYREQLGIPKAQYRKQLS